MDRERVVTVCMGLYALALVVENAVSIAVDGFAPFAAAFVLVGLGVVAMLARNVARGTTDEGIRRIAENDLWFWSLVVLFALGVAGVVLDLSNAGPV